MNFLTSVSGILVEYSLFSKIIFLFLLERRSKIKSPHFPKEAVFIILSDGKVIPCVEKLLHDKEFLNGKEVGFEKAFYDMPDFSCEGCFRNCYNEYNAFINLAPNGVFNSLKNMRT